MFSNTERNKELYIPDFKLWADYYQKQVSAQWPSEQNIHPSFSSDESKVQVKLVSPIAQTTDQAESIMKTDSQVIRKKKKKNKKLKSKSKANKSNGHKKATKKTAATGRQTFYVRKLKDIFSSNGKK